MAERVPLSEQIVQIELDILGAEHWIEDELSGKKRRRPDSDVDAKRAAIRNRKAVLETLLWVQKKFGKDPE